MRTRTLTLLATTVAGVSLMAGPASAAPGGKPLLGTTDTLTTTFPDGTVNATYTISFTKAGSLGYVDVYDNDGDDDGGRYNRNGTKLQMQVENDVGNFPAGVCRFYGHFVNGQYQGNFTCPGPKGPVDRWYLTGEYQD